MATYDIAGDTHGLTYTLTNSTTAPNDGSVVADIQLWGGTPGGDTSWLDGGAAAGSYPGSLDGFKAKNTNTTDAMSGMRLVTLQFDLKHASLTTLDVAKKTGQNTAFSKIMAVIGQSHQAGTHVYTVLADSNTVNITPQATADKYQITLLLA
jgi:hypothetical protein